jgi:hypothetical protein
MWTGITAFVKGGDLPVQVGRVEVEGIVNLGDHRDGSRRDDRRGGGNGGIGGDDHLVAGSNARSEPAYPRA